MDTWKLKDLRDGKDYRYIVELEGNVLTRRYGWDGGKLRKATRSFDNANDARTEADKIVNAKVLEGYVLEESPETAPVGSADTGSSDLDTDDLVSVLDDNPADDTLFPIVQIMKVRDARIEHPVLICALPSGYRFKVNPTMEYGKEVVGQKVRLSYDSVGPDGTPMDPTIVEVICE